MPSSRFYRAPEVLDLIAPQSWESPFVAIAVMLLFFGGCFYLVVTVPSYLQTVYVDKEMRTDKSLQVLRLLLGDDAR